MKKLLTLFIKELYRIGIIFYLIIGVCYSYQVNAQVTDKEFIKKAYIKAYNYYLEGKYSKSLAFLDANSFVNRDKSNEFWYLKILNLNASKRSSKDTMILLDYELKEFLSTVNYWNFNLKKYSDVLKISIDQSVFIQNDKKNFQLLSKKLTNKDSINLKLRMGYISAYIEDVPNTYFKNELLVISQDCKDTLETIRKTRNLLEKQARINKNLKSIGNFSTLELSYSFTGNSNNLGRINNESELESFLLGKPYGTNQPLMPDLVCGISLISFDIDFPQAKRNKLAIIWTLFDVSFHVFKNKNTEFLKRQKNSYETVNASKIYSTFLGTRIGLMHSILIGNSKAISPYWQLIPAINFLNYTYQYEITDSQGAPINRIVTTNAHKIVLSNELGVKFYFNHHLYISMFVQLRNYGWNNKIIQGVESVIDTYENSKLINLFGFRIGV